MGSNSLIRLACILAIVFLMTVDLEGMVEAGTPSRSRSHSRSRTPSSSPSTSLSVTKTRPSRSSTRQPSQTPTNTVTPTLTPSFTPSKSVSPTPSVTASRTPSVSGSATRTKSPTRTRTPTTSVTPSFTRTAAPFCTDNTVTITVDGATISPATNIHIYLFATNPGDYPSAGGGIGIENRTLSTQTTSVEIPVLGSATFPTPVQITPITFFSGQMSTNYPQIWPNWTGYKGGCVGTPASTTANCALDSLGAVSCTVNFVGLIDSTTPCSHVLTFKACWRKVNSIASYPQSTLYLFPYSPFSF